MGAKAFGRRRVDRRTRPPRARSRREECPLTWRSRVRGLAIGVLQTGGDPRVQASNGPMTIPKAARAERDSSAAAGVRYIRSLSSRPLRRRIYEQLSIDH